VGCVGLGADYESDVTEHCRNSSQPLGDCHAREEAQEEDRAQTRRLQEEAEEAPRSRRQLKLGRSVGASVTVS
jgi:hypothetical protein